MWVCQGGVGRRERGKIKKGGAEGSGRDGTGLGMTRLGGASGETVILHTLCT